MTMGLLNYVSNIVKQYSLLIFLGTFFLETKLRMVWKKNQKSFNHIMTFFELTD